MADITDKLEEEKTAPQEDVGDSMEDVALGEPNGAQNGGHQDEHTIEDESTDQGEMTFEPIEGKEPQTAQEDTAETPQPIPETPPPPPAASEATEPPASLPTSPPLPSVQVSTPETQSNGFRSTSGASVFSPGRSRTDSQSTTATNPAPGGHRNSLVFVSSALEHIVASKDAQKRKELGDAAQLALKEIKTKGDPQQIDPKVLFQPLRLATDAQTESVVTTALDCIGKLISYSYFTAPAEGEADGAVSLIDQAIDTICQCFEGEGTADRVQLQIIISLLAAVLNDKVVVHGAGLLKAVRQMYNIFLHSKNTRTQQVAQGSLSQMVNTVFERARKRVAGKEYRAHQSKTLLTQEDADSDEPDSIVNGDVTKAVANGEQEQDEDNLEEPQDMPVEKEAANKMTLQTFERRGSFDEDRLREGPTTVTKARGRRGTVISVDRDSQLSDEDEEDEVYMKDAFLVFRAMCKISIKSLRPEEILDLRSQGMRAKLLSLHIVHTILFHNVTLFLSPHATIRSNSNTESTPFTQAVKQLLCQSLSRNGASSVNKVFEVGCEIFWIMLKDLRMVLKKEVEVFLKEIYLSILDNRTAPYFQKQCFLNTLARLAHDPRALVEIYLNYDCDRTASDNMYQRITEHLARLCTVPINVTSVSLHAYQQHQKKSQLQDWQLRGTMPSTLSSAVTYQVEPESTFPHDLAMKQQSLEAIVDILRSLVHWSQQGLTARQVGLVDPAKVSTDAHRDSAETRPSEAITASYALGIESPPPGTPLVEDDPMQLEKEKQMKTAMLDAVRQFNYKPKRGIKVLIDNGFVKDKSPESIATFLLYTDRLDKAAIGEYLGEADPENVAIMHAFVDLMDFTKTRFTEALRRFLQAFRLPGEAQKIDRFMLKFAERYIVGNPNAFANADTAYVLAFSVIMLNTDQHSPTLKGKKRMTPEDFIKNNRGINDNADLPDDYLRAIFEEIASNEIVLDTEREREAKMGREPQPVASGFAANIGQAFATVGRDLQREAYVQRSEETANKTEQMFKSLLRAQKKGTVGDGASRFIPATSYRHAGPMFDVSWMSFLTALSGCAQDSENLETVKLCMEGLRLAVQISCLFELDNPRQAFIQSITRFTNLYNLSDMKQKNVEALRVLLDVAHTEGNALKTSWRDILTCISQLDRFQLISDGVPMQSIPDVFKAQPAPSSSRTSTSRKSLQIPDRSRNKSGVASFSQEVAEESRSASIMNGVDRIFTSTNKLNGDAIVHFVTALCQVSWQEIESSGQSQEPRTYSLQKLVEVSEYNMSRVRFEWTNIWHVLGEHFNLVGCHTNTRVVHFALNSLRQLSIRFLDKEELPGFKFQKDFLKPFEHIINNATVVQVKEIVLHSLIQMIQARGENIRSGWRTIFGAFTVAARERFESIVSLAYENVLQIYNTRLGVVMAQGAFPDLIVCLTDFSKNSRFQKKSLQAIETLKGTIPKMLKTPECPLSSTSPSTQTAARQANRQTQEEQYFFPVLFAFHDVLMTGDDLEVRSRALNYLFDTIIKYGKEFPPEFWDTIWRQLLYPIFMVMKSKPEMSKMVNHEELSVWLSTTMIQALRNMMTLFTHYFESLEYMLDRFLDLLALCICQENDTLARIGSNCLQTLILQNVNKFTEEHWTKIVSAFVDLFNRTEATALFSAVTNPHGTNGTSRPTLSRNTTSEASVNDPAPPRTPTRQTTRDSTRSASGMSNGDKMGTIGTGLQSPISTEPPTPGALEDYRPEEKQLHQAPIVVTAARRRFFNQIITKCVLQLLLIETVNELFSNDNVYAQIPSMELLRLMALLKKSYQFAKRFNDDLDLRNRLFQEGFMKQPPNLLKQESGSASVYVNILFRMYHDEGEERKNNRAQTEAALIPLCVDIIESYLQLKEETQQRNIITWRPVVIDVIDGYAALPQDGFEKHAGTFAPLATSLLGRDMGIELQRVVQALVHRIFELHYEMPALEAPLVEEAMMSPNGKGQSFGGRSRRASRTSVGPR